MPRNKYISHGTSNEKDLYENLISECIQIFGHDVYYLPRSIVQLDTILNEDVISKFDKSYVTEMYVESIDGFEGDGKLITKFGLEIRDQLTLVVSKKRWDLLVGKWGNPEPYLRPAEGDLIYIPFVNGLYEIKYTDDKKPFLQLGGKPTYKLVCELFEYANQTFDTGIKAIDNIQGYSSAGFSVLAEFDNPNFFVRNEKITITLPGSIVGSAEVLKISDTDIELEKDIFIGPLSWNDGAFRLLSVGGILTSVNNGLTANILNVKTISNSSDDSDDNDINNQNVAFEVAGSGFIDFSESNPFSDGPIL